MAYQNEWRAACPAVSAVGALPMWKEGDKVSPMQLAAWMKEMKDRKLSDDQVANEVTAWRAGAVPWGQLTTGAPLGKAIQYERVAPALKAGLGKAGGFLVGVALLWFLARR